MDRYFVVHIIGKRYAHLFAEGGYNSIDIGKPCVGCALASGIILKHADDGILFLRFRRLFFNYQIQPPQEFKIPVGGIHERAGALRFEIRGDDAVIAIDALAVLVRLDLGEAFVSRCLNVTAERVKTTNERAVRMDAASPGIEEDAGAVFFPIQNGSAVVGVAVNEVGSGKAPVGGKARDFVRVDLDFLVAAAKKALRTQEVKRRLSV